MFLLQDLLKLLTVENELSPSDLEVKISSIGALDSAEEGQLSFLASSKYRQKLQSTNASVVLITEKELGNCPSSVIPLVVADPYLSYAKISHLFDPIPRGNKRVASTAVIDPSAVIGTGVSIGAYAVVSAGVVIGEDCEIGPHVVIDENAQIGKRTRIQARVTIAHQCTVGIDCSIQCGTVIGSNGFGYAPTESGWQAIAQIGSVNIGDRVHIGANCTIDRGAIGDTIIDSDVIIDNLVHIAHNVEIGKRTALAGQVGIAGSTVIGQNCTAGGQVGFTGHIAIADGSHFTGQAMVTKGTKEPGLYSSGIPAQSSKDWRKLIARLRQLGLYNDRLTSLELQLKEKL